MRMPSYNPITLLFDSADPPYNASSRHNGVDYAYTPNDVIYAPESGRVTLEYDAPGSRNGNTVHLYVGNRHHAFCHMSIFEVGQNQTVSEGQRLGIMGSTGYATGKHLHWAVAVSGTLVNPLSLVTPGRGAEEQDMINDYDNEFNRWRATFVMIRGREPSREEFRISAVGKSWLRALEILEDSEEATAVQQAQELGQLAKRDNWQNQIYSLSDQLTKNNAVISELQKKADLSVAQQKQIEELKTANQACIDQQVADQAAGEGFFRSLGKLLRLSKK